MNKFSELFVTTTDTVTGLGAPVSQENMAKIFELKRRPETKPLIIMVGSMDQARNFKEWDDKAEEYAKKYWPGQVTLVLTDKLSLRMPGNNSLRELLLKKGPCYMTSANISGEPVLSLEEAKKTFSELTEFHDFGPGSGKPSKIIKVSTGEILR